MQRRESQGGRAAQQQLPSRQVKPSGRVESQQPPYPPHIGAEPDWQLQRSSHPLPQAVHPMQPHPERLQHQQAGKPEVVGAEGGSPGLREGKVERDKPSLCEASPFSDPEMGGMDKAGDVSVLGYKFHRQTTINW